MPPMISVIARKSDGSSDSPRISVALKMPSKGVASRQTRRDRLVEALAAEAGHRLPVETPDGGMQLLARCRPHIDDEQLAARLLEAGVVSRALTRMLYHRTAERGLFLGFAAWNEKEIDRAAHILARVIRRAS
jgi:GntR family transcriptional regulator/MocR family aminotransferase